MTNALNGEWDIIISSLQDICQANQANSIDSISIDATKLGKYKTEEDLRLLNTTVTNHRENVDKSLRLIQPLLDNLQHLINLKQLGNNNTISSTSPNENELTNVKSSSKSNADVEKGEKSAGEDSATSTRTGSGITSGSTAEGKGPAAGSAASGSTLVKKRRGDLTKKGKSYYSSPYNPSEPIVVGSEVAYRAKNGIMGNEWIQCEVMKVIDHNKFDVRDPEPDENNNPGKTYRATWKEVSLIPTVNDAKELINYPFGTKVIARYPETTTFYPAEVIGAKRDGRCRLRFDGEEEVGKETEVERRLVLPYPDPKSHN